MSEKQGFKKAWIVFAFGRSGDGYTFYEMKEPKKTEYDGKSDLVFDGISRARRFDVKLFKHQSCGAIFEVELSDKLISYNKDQKPVGYHLNRDDRAAWRLRQAAIDGAAKAKKDGARNDLSELLEPIRREYLESNSREERRFIIAEVIRVITSGRV